MNLRLKTIIRNGIDPRLSLDKFATKQVLDKRYRKHCRSYLDERWWGEYDKNYSAETVSGIIEAFENDREENFRLVRESDYKYSYKSLRPIRGVEIYIKHYRVFHAKYSKTAIFRRNLLRRALAKKAFALNYTLRELGIPTIENVFYVANRGSFISRDAYYVSVAIPDSMTLTHYLETYFGDAAERLERLAPPQVLRESGRLVADLLRKGLRIYHKELLANLLVQDPGDGIAKLRVIDLDIVEGISPFREAAREAEMERIRSHLRWRLGRAGADPALVKYFDEGAASCRS
jgi:hypothetical protein